MELVHNYRGFWKENDYPYIKAVEITAEELSQLINRLNRRDVIEWLMWNDRNGVYSDEDSLREFGLVMTLEEGIEIMLRQVEENKVAIRTLKI
jgi:hypothetical protein